MHTATKRQRHPPAPSVPFVDARLMPGIGIPPPPPDFCSAFMRSAMELPRGVGLSPSASPTSTNVKRQYHTTPHASTTPVASVFGLLPSLVSTLLGAGRFCRAGDGDAVAVGDPMREPPDCAARAAMRSLILIARGRSCASSEAAGAATGVETAGAGAGDGAGDVGCATFAAVECALPGDLGDDDLPNLALNSFTLERRGFEVLPSRVR